MSKSIRLFFGDGEHNFRLAIGELRELQGKCDAGPATIMARLMSYQPQAEKQKRPKADAYELGKDDPDFLADINVYSMLRSFGGDWRIDDVHETIRLGLIGAGTNPMEAFVLVSKYVDMRPLTENTGLAAQILIHALSGEVDDPVGKPLPETVKTEMVRAANV